MAALLVFLLLAFQLELPERFENALVERIEQTGGLKVIDPRQIAARAKPKMTQEFLRGRVEQGAPGAFAAL